MIRTLVRVEYQAKWQGSPIRLYGFLLAFYTALLGVLVLGMWWYRYHPQMHAGRTGRKLFTTLTMIETAVIMGITPLLPLHAIHLDRAQQMVGTLALNPIRSATIVWGKLLLPLALAIGIIGASDFVVAGLMLTLRGVSVGDLLITHGLVLAYTCGFLLLGCCCALVCHTVQAALGTTTLITTCLAGGVVLAAPLIRHLPQAEPLIQTVLLVNPFVGVATALGVDMMRTAWLYVLSPIGQRQFTYPAWYAVALCYLGFSSLLGLTAIWQVAWLRRHADRW